MSLVGDTYRSLFGRVYFRRFNELLFRLSLHGLGVLNFRNARVSGEAYFVTEVLPGLIDAQAPLFFDVGANEGQFVSLLIATFPTAFAHAFEPHPRNYERLTARGLPVDRVKCHNIALADIHGAATLYDRADFDGSSHASLHEEVISAIHKQQITQVPIQVDTLDAVAARERVHRIDYLKIDTEGSELAVLKGAEELLRRACIGCIQFEFNEMNVSSRVFLRDFKSVLSGYDLFRLLPRGMIPLGDSPLYTELFAYQNIVAIRKR